MISHAIELMAPFSERDEHVLEQWVRGRKDALKARESSNSQQAYFKSARGLTA